MNYFSMGIVLIFISIAAIGANSFEYGFDLAEFEQNYINSINDVNLTYQPGRFDQEGFINIDRVMVISYSYINFLLEAIGQGILIALDFGYNNHEYFDVDKFFKFANFALILILIAILIKPLTYLLVGAILFVMVFKEWLEKRKKKREDEKAKQMKGGK